MRTLLRLLIAATVLPTTADDLPSLPDPPEAAYPAIERFVEALETARTRHHDVDRLAYDRLVNHAIDGMLRSLDRHSSFLHPHAVGADPTKIELPLPIEELGATLDTSGEGWQLAAVEDPGPAFNSGAKPGDRLLAVGAIDATTQQTAALIGLLRGPAGSKLTLKLAAPNDAAREITVTRRAIDDQAVRESRLLPDTDPPAGYLRLAQFTKRAPREIEAALDELEDAGMKRLILDLRGNPGGDLHATVELLGLFLPPATEVVTTRGRDKQQAGPPLLTPERQRRQRDYPLAVLIDRHSASASELSAGALQDLKRAVIVGERSYGKGSVQQIMPLSGGTAMRLTIATYHTPSGETPHNKGIKPDLPVTISETDRRLATITRHRKSATPEQLAELKNWTDPVIQAALGRTR